MTKREIIKLALEGQEVPYCPWHFAFTWEAQKKLLQHYELPDVDGLEIFLGNHLVYCGNAVDYFVPMGQDHVKDIFGVVWNRSVDKDIGVVANQLLPGHDLSKLKLPDHRDLRCFADIEARFAKFGDRFRIFPIGFSLFERAWTFRGMENLLLDFYDEPQFVHDLLEKIADYNIAQLNYALDHYDFDGVYFGDDWGQQHGLIMGKAIWLEFLAPQLCRMYQAVRNRGKKVFIHSCGDVAELFDDLIELGVNCFNPFQPEVMDCDSLMLQYHGRLAFHGGLSTQQILPYGSVDAVKTASENLLKKGRKGGYIFAPAHAVEGDVPLPNIIAFFEAAQTQKITSDRLRTF